MLPDKIYKAMYPSGYKPHMFCQPVPKEVKPSSESLVDMLTSFIGKYVTKNTTKVLSVTKKMKKMYIINTNAHCQTCNKDNLQFKIKQNSVLEQLCTCKTRSHNLLDKIKRVL